eukprot:c20466_g1_i1 orf=292-2865(-)
MGKSGKLFKSLVAGVRVFKSPSKERPAKEKSVPHANKKEDKDRVRKGSKDKCFGNLGKSSSRSRDVAAAASSPDAIEIKCVQVESERLKDVLPIAESFTTESSVSANKGPVKAQGVNAGHVCNQLSQTGPKGHISNREEWAASKIQAAFRCYLAQRAFRALKALVRIQALVRGQTVRRQASTSLRCMNAIIRIQALARGHRVRSSELGQLVQKHLQQTRQSRKRPAEGWVNSMATAQQLHAKAQSKQDAVTKRQRALVYAFSEQLNRRTQKQSSSLGLENQVDKSHWVWIWLERWTAATPKGSPVTASVEECTVVTKTVEKPKTTRVGKHLEGSKKDGRKLNEHADGTTPPQRGFSPEGQEKTANVVVKKEEKMKASTESERLSTPPQRGFSPEGQEKTANVVVKKEEKMKASTESERLSIRKANVSGSNPTTSTITVVQKPLSSPPAPSTPPLSSFKDDSLLATKETGCLDTAQPLDSSAMSEVMDWTSPVSVIESTLAPPLIVSDNSLHPATCEIHAVGAEITMSPDTKLTSLTSPTLQSLPLSMSDTSNGSFELPACTTMGTVFTGFDSPGRMAYPNSSSILSFSPAEAYSPSKPLSPIHPVEEEEMQRLSATNSPREQGTFFREHHASPPPPLCTPDNLAHEALSNGMQMPEGPTTYSINGDDGVHISEEPVHSINGDTTVVFSEAASTVNEDTGSEPIQADAFSETNGRCDASVSSVGAKSVEVSSKHTTTGQGLKHELQAECVSPSVPSYMATTKSSKAKIRTLSSPKQKSESPKPKLDSPKPKVDSPTQKVDSASKRRHSLSGLDGKVSPGIQKSALHVRASSKGQLSLSKDLSTDNLALSNGDSRRHEK